MRDWQEREREREQSQTFNKRKKMEGQEELLTIKTPWEELERRFRAILEERPGDSGEEEACAAYESCLKVEGKSILPPLMTAEKRARCREWKTQAVVRERERQPAAAEEEDMESWSETQDDSSESDSEVVYSRVSHSHAGEDALVVPVPREEEEEEEERASGAFKALIHRLRGDLAREGRPSHHESTQSVDTVVENPAFARRAQEEEEEEEAAVVEEEDLDDDEEVSMRRRSGSYTLDEPSPLLKAYMERYGDGDMSFSGKLPKVRTPRRAPAEVLNSYLASLSATPRIAQQQPDRGVVARTPPAEEVPIPQGTDDDSRDGLEGRSDDDESVASSAMKSTSVQVPAEESVREVQEELSKTGDREAGELTDGGTKDSVEDRADDPPVAVPECELPVPDSEITESSVILKDVRPGTADTFASSSTFLSMHPVDSRLTASRQIETAVSSLAQEQQKRVSQLMRQQEEQRRELTRYFREQQQKLIDEILESVQQGTSGLPSVPTPLPFDLPPRSGSPVVPAVAPNVRPVSVLQPDYSLPAEALAPEMGPKFCRLTAVARGYLTRRLMRTHKVQSLVASIRDTMATALQLHRESSMNNNSVAPSVSPQDVELHRRLLQQINKDCQSIHHLFFETSTQERMSVIAMDFEIRRKEADQQAAAAAAAGGGGGGGGREEGSKERRVSAATMARLEEKQRAADLARREPQRTRARRATWTRRDKENRPVRTRSASSHRGNYNVA